MQKVKELCMLCNKKLNKSEGFHCKSCDHAWKQGRRYGLLDIAKSHEIAAKSLRDIVCFMDKKEG